MIYALFMNLIKIILIAGIFLFNASMSYALEGLASYYTYESAVKSGNSGIMANGHKMDNEGFTCAFNDLPFNTILKVTNINNGKFCFVKVTDRGNYKKYHRIIDLSKGAFSSIADLKKGVILVKIEVIK
jgi:rare lipoprotein A